MFLLFQLFSIFDNNQRRNGGGLNEWSYKVISEDDNDGESFQELVSCFETYAKYKYLRKILWSLGDITMKIFQMLEIR